MQCSLIAGVTQKRRMLTQRVHGDAGGKVEVRLPSRIMKSAALAADKNDIVRPRVRLQDVPERNAGRGEYAVKRSY